MTTTSEEISEGAAFGRALAYGAAGGALTLAGWFVLHSLSLPAFNTSYVTRALATGASLVLLVLAAATCWFWLRGRRGWVSEPVVALVPAGLVLSSLGIPLSATRLYLDGIQVDQGFRTQFLSRMAQSVSHGDMSYVDLPSFYPLGWFWLGGRVANLLHFSGWEVYQPWALASIAAAAAALTPIWRHLTGSLPVAGAIAVATTAVVLTKVPQEPYAAIVAMFFPAAVVAAQRALRGSWWATAACAAYLGVSATFYTLFTAVAALTVVVLAVIACFRGPGPKRWLVPLERLVIIGVGSLAIALISWGPYLKQLLTGDYAAESTANHYLPQLGAYFPLPFFSLSIVGLLSLVGLVYLVVRVGEEEVDSLTVAALTCYLWILLSMAVTALGTTLLGFRVEAMILVLFATAGVLGIADARLAGIERFYPGRLSAQAQRAVTTVLVVLVAAGSLLYVQQIPAENESYIDQAYADTDGFGERADRFPPDAGRYYSEIVDYLAEHGRYPGESVVYTDEINFMAFHPFYGFNAFTSHYANPLGEFEKRNEALTQWAELSKTSPEGLTEAIDSAPWRAPEAFIFRGNLEKSPKLKTHIAHDIFPNQPNVRYEATYFDATGFSAADWDERQIGPFVVVVRK